MGEVASSNLAVRSNRRAPFDPGLVHREVMRPGRDRDHGYHRGPDHFVRSPIRRFELPEASVARNRPEGPHLLDIRQRNSLTMVAVCVANTGGFDDQRKWSGPFPSSVPMDRSTSGEVTTLSRWRGWVRIPHGLPIFTFLCGHSSVGRARSFQVRCREFKPRCPLHFLPL